MDASDLWSSGAHGRGQLAFDAVPLLDHASAKNTGKAITCDEQGTVDVQLHDRDVAEVGREQCRRGRSAHGPCDPHSGKPRPDLHVEHVERVGPEPVNPDHLLPLSELAGRFGVLIDEGITRDFDIGRLVTTENFQALKAVAQAANAALIDLEHSGETCAPDADTLQRIVLPSTKDGVAAPGLRFGDPRVVALLAGLVSFTHLVAGFTNASLRTLVEG
ncbi:MAG: hypothetical protein JWL57_2265, partial [Actinobacteria bacterium]|nr:hypothetical protein [Actinomycetota bacterium]